MKARIKFQKYGSMKFISHLDVMRYFQKLFCRAEIDNEFTKGYSPHQIMSFAAPLGVGLTSDSEYLDVELKTADAPEIMIKRMNEATTEGFRIIGFHPLLEREENQKAVTAMSLVSTADYLVSLKDGYSLAGVHTINDLKEQFRAFLDRPEIVIDKRTKNSEKAVDIKPMITLVAFDESEYREKLKTVLASYINNDQKPESSADQYDNANKLYLQLDTGSSVNLKPELVMEAFYDYLSVPFEKYAWQVHRLEVYKRDAESGKLISLDRLDR